MQDFIENIPSVDWALSLHIATGKPKLAKELFTMMIISLPKEQQLINSAFKNNKLQQLQEQIHKLHGGCCYTGFSKLKYIAKSLEQKIITYNKDNQNQLDQITNYIALLNKEIDFLITKYSKLNVPEFSVF